MADLNADQIDELAKIWQIVKRADEDIARLRQECHSLKQAISPSRAGPEPWEGMPDAAYFIRVAAGHRLFVTTVNPRHDAAASARRDSDD